VGNSWLAPRPSRVNYGPILRKGRVNYNRWIIPLNGHNINGLHNDGIWVDEVITKVGVVSTAVSKGIAISKARKAIGNAKVVCRKTAINADESSGS